MKHDLVTMEIHPAANIFPMMADDEREALIADIKANGLLHPIIVHDGVLIDGRNRRDACLALGIEPRFEELNGTDPVAYILATNVNRRHLSKGQRAMAVAKLYPEGQQGQKGTSLKNHDVDRSYVSQARTVLRFLPEIAHEVMAGKIPLNDAYVSAQRVKEQADGEPKRLQRLRERAPDLADLVEEGRVSLLEAQSLYETRQESERREHLSVIDNFNNLERWEDFFAEGARRTHLVTHLRHADRARAKQLLRRWIDNLTATLEALA